MQTTTETSEFQEGIRYYGEAWERFEALGAEPVLGGGEAGDPESEAFAYQTLLAADAFRYLTLQVAGSKGSGHPGGFCSSADVHAALFMLGEKNLLTEVGHHAPGYYSALFLDRSLEAMGIRTVGQLGERFRETGGLLGHLSGAIPGILSPAGPLGQGQHFALGAAYLNPGTLFPVTIGDGGMGEPYVMSAFRHFTTAFPDVTNYLPILIWNGYSQEHHSMVSTLSDEEMLTYWRSHGFEEIVLVDAKEFDDRQQEGPYVDSTLCALPARIAFMRAILGGLDRCRKSCLGENGTGRPSLFIIKQIKGAGSHAYGSKSHHLYPQFTLDHPDIQAGLKRRALSEAAWETVRANLAVAGGGPAAEIVVTEHERPLPALPELPFTDHPVGGDAQIPSTHLGPLAVAVGKADPFFLVGNADGNEASGLRNISDGLLIRHPSEDALYSQGPTGRVFEPISEDACAGLTGAIALFGGRSLWLSYESFAVNGLPFYQTVTQAMAELRRRTPAVVAMFTAGALEQGRNGWTHQRPEVESYFMALTRNGNVFPLFPIDANMIQAAYAWALAQQNKGVAIFASKTAMPVRLPLAEARAAIEAGAVTLYETPVGNGPLIVLTGAGDLIFNAMFEAKDTLEAAGYRVRIVAVTNPRRLYRRDDVAWEETSNSDGSFMDDGTFASLFEGDALIGVTGGPGAVLEPVLLRTQAPRRLLCWKRGETTASPAALMALNKVDANSIVTTVQKIF